MLLDSVMSNIDRTTKNTNLLIWKNELWVIDNGASFYFHHNWETWRNHLTRTFPMIKDNVLIKQANHLSEAAETIKTALTAAKIAEIVAAIPADWLEDEAEEMSPKEMRAAYIEYLDAKLAMIDSLVKEAKDAR